MQADAQGRACAAYVSRLFRCGPVDHQARAREDARAMRLDDPAVDAAADAEIVGRDDEELRRCGHSARGGRSASNQRSEWMRSLIPHAAPSCSAAIASN